MAERKTRDEKRNLTALVHAALVPHMKDQDRRRFLRSLEQKDKLHDNLDLEEQKRENERAKQYFRTYNFS